MRIIHADVIFLLHAFDQLLNQFIERAIHLHLAKPFLHFFVQQISFHQRLLDGAAQIVESLLAISVHVVEHVVLEAALQEVIGERAQQVFHAHLAGWVGNVFAVTDAFHKSGSWPLAFGRWSTALCVIGGPTTAANGQRPTAND